MPREYERCDTLLARKVCNLPSDDIYKGERLNEKEDLPPCRFCKFPQHVIREEAGGNVVRVGCDTTMCPNNQNTQKLKFTLNGSNLDNLMRSGLYGSKMFNIRHVA